MRAHLLFDHHLAVILKDLVHVLCDASSFDASPVGIDVCGRANGTPCTRANRIEPLASQGRTWIYTRRVVVEASRWRVP